MEKKKDQSPNTTPMQRWNASRAGRAILRVLGRTNSNAAANSSRAMTP